MEESVRLLRAKVGHARFWPKKNSFVYDVFYVEVPILEENKSITSPVLFSLNRLNVLSVHNKDFGYRSKSRSLRSFIVDELKHAKAPLVAGETVTLISHPRLFGFAFNPISYWMVRTARGDLRAVLCEVHNTFGDTHNYLLMKPKSATINPSDTLHADKKLFVSPYNKMEGRYEFEFKYSEESFKSVIRYFDSKRKILDTFMGGSFQPLTSLGVLGVCFKYPVMTMLVVVRIHWQAVVLFFKRVPRTLRLRPKPYKSGETTQSKKR